MTASGAEFFTMDEVNRLRVIQDVVDRRLTIHLAAELSVFPTGLVAACSSATVQASRP